MKAKSYVSRILSVLLVTVMLFSCWVFSTPTSTTTAAATSVNIDCEGYCVRVKINEGSSFDPQNDNTNLADANGNEYALIYYNKLNGVSGGATGSYKQNLSDRDGDGNSDIVSSWGQSEGYFPSSSGVNIPGWPTGLYTLYIGNGSYKATLQLWNRTSSSWVSITSEQTSSNSNNNLTTNTSVTAAYPYANSNTNPTVSYSTGTMNVPKSGTSTNSISALNTPVCQYGYSMGATITLSSTADVGQFSQSLWDTSFGNSAHIAGTTNSQTVTATVTWAQTSGTAVSRETSFTLQDESYSVTFRNNTAGDTMAQVGDAQSVQYGDNASPPAAQSKAYDSDYHYTWNGWGNYSDIQADRTVDCLAYTPVAHGSWSYSEIADDHANHTQTCGGCAYNFTSAHHYSVSFSFADNGQSATATRTCTDGTCGHSQTANLTLGNGITSAQQAAPGCTTQGTTRYTATSPWGDGATGTKDVADISETGHDIENVPWTYSDASGHFQVCKTCKAELNKTGHVGSAAVRENEVAATCTTAGSYDSVVYCRDCNFEISRTENTIPALNHDTTDEDWQTDAGHHWKNCKNGCGTPQNYGEHDWITKEGSDAVKYTEGTGTHAGEHYKECSVCHYKDYESHGSYTPSVTDPTCTTGGYTTYTCACGYSYTGAETAALGHDVTDQDYVVDDNDYHWKECNNCHEPVNLVDGVWTAGKLAHSWDAGTIDPAATCTTTGLKTYECTVCGNQSRTEVLATIAHNYSEDSIRTAATTKTAAGCLNDAEYYYTCTMCHRSSNNAVYSYTVPDSKLGHDTENIIRVPLSQLDDGLEGSFIFQCPRCEKYLAAAYNTTDQEWIFDPEDEGSATKEDPSLQQTIANPTLCNFVDSSIVIGTNGSGEPEYLDYFNKPSSLRVENTVLPEEKNDFFKQPLRFCGSAMVPTGVTFCADYSNYMSKVFENGELKSKSQLEALRDDATLDNCILDFGFLYTQESVCRNGDVDFNWNEDFVLDSSYRIYRMSVVKNNAAKSGYSSWRGYTQHAVDAAYANSITQRGLDIGSYLTYNLVININAKNWDKRYEGRCYIIYKYRGEVYTVYDQIYNENEGSLSMSERSVLGYSFTMYAICEDQEATESFTARYLDSRLNWWCDKYVDLYNAELIKLEEEPIDAEEYRNQLSYRFYYDLPDDDSGNVNRTHG